MAWGVWRFRLLDIVPAARDAVVESMEDGVIVMDVQGRVVDVNPAAEAVLDQPAAQAFSERTGVLDLLGKDHEGCGEVVLEDNGERRTFDIRVSPLTDQSKRLSGRFIVLRDVSDRKQAEEELQGAKEAAEAANKAKSEFMSVASHEMRTPITCIKGYTDLLAKFLGESADDAHVEFLETIRLNADRLATLVSDLSDMARIESGRLRLELGTVEIKEVVREAVSGIRTQVDEKDQTLSVDIPEGVPTVRGDHDSLVRVTANLLSNACKFTPAGGRIMVRAECVDDEVEGTVVHVAVKDNGIGIKPEELERVFEKFYRSDDREASELPGSGLGLSIASSLVEMQGGRIWLESVFREGTTVHFTVPTPQDA
jgi:signal transduction histidine kinase